MSNLRDVFPAQNRLLRFFMDQRAKCTGGEADYLLARYLLAEGTPLLSQEGGLLARLGLKLSDSLDTLANDAESWPILPRQREATLRHLRSLQSGEICLSYAFDVMLDPADSPVWLSITALRRRLEGQELLELLFVDLESERIPLDQLVKSTATDPLTGALNRTFAEEITGLLAADEEPHIFIMLDLDGFKTVNDTCGHTEGDRVLSEVFHSLQAALGSENMLCRVGGDEFFIAITEPGDQPDSLARRICALVRRTLPSNLSISASLGVVVSPRDGRDFQTLYQKADLAMYHAKRQGGNRWLLYDPSLRMEADVRPSARLFPVPNVSSILAYDGRFTYSAASMPFADEKETRTFWSLLLEEGIADEKDAEDVCLRILRLAESGQSGVESQEYLFCIRGTRHHYLITFLCTVPGMVQLVLTDMSSKVLQVERLRSMAEYDRLTGLLNRTSFCARLDRFFQDTPGAAVSGGYALVYLDVERFKAVNDLYGQDAGNRLLIFIADLLSRAADPEGYATRTGSDRFAVLVHASGTHLEELVQGLILALSRYSLPMEINCNAGIYVIQDDTLTADAMLDRATMAQDAVKGRYDQRFGYYSEAMRWQLLNEQALAGSMTSALEDGQFLVYYQPQYNHATGMLVGAEALVRWKDPVQGLLPPGDFIPLFEKNGFITRLDLYVFEQVCRFQRRCLDLGLPAVPISVNVTRYDIFQPDFPDRLESLRRKYAVPASLIRMEITESAVMGSSDYVNSVVKRLHECGYVIEMDDFGSGYSSLNVLKDIDLDVIKLDMRFLAQTSQTGRGGTILSSVVRMAKWMSLPVIAEGVETREQADFLRSIGCNYIQGYLYARPMPAAEYELLLRSSGTAVLQQSLIRADLNAARFWDPNSLETLVFSNLVGAAAVVDYHQGTLHVLRVNRRYLTELGTSQREEDFLSGDPMRFFDEAAKADYFRALELAAETGEEQECETWRHYTTECCGDEDICLRSTIQLLGSSEIGSLFYVLVRNITAEKRRVLDILDSERRFKAASEQANIYYWEYTVATKEMRPCFRCMRDLELPPLVKNYPEPAIEAGIFPPEVAEEYRDWHRQIAAGVPHLEGIMPLTVGRVPFHVRYTTEFDEHGRPIKAYGSATLVVDQG